MTEMTSPAVAINPPAPGSGPGLATQLRRLSYRLAAKVVPGLAGRIAADAFGRSRAKGSRTQFRMPLGAVSFEISGNQDVRRGFIWRNQGPTVLLVHGWGSDSSSMLGLVKPLLALGFQVAAFDAPAHGESPGNQTTMSRFVAAVAAVIATLGKVEVMIGHSLGSIATVAALSRAEPHLAQTVRRLVLIAAPSSLVTVLESWAANQQLPAPIKDKVYQRLLLQNGVPVSHWDISVLGRGFDLPILVVHDEDDRVVPICEAKKLAQELQNVSLQQTSGLGHSRILSAADVKQMICTFITQT